MGLATNGAASRTESGRGCDLVGTGGEDGGGLRGRGRRERRTQRSGSQRREVRQFPGSPDLVNDVSRRRSCRRWPPDLVVIIGGLV